MLPAIDPNTGLMPVGIHPATLREIQEQFVEKAPFREERELIFRAMSVYLDIVSAKYSSPRVLLNGGFVTHKPWAAPKDADLAIGLDTPEFKHTSTAENLQFSTLVGVNISKPYKMYLPKIQPMLGLVDGYFFPAKLKPHVHYWEDYWGKVRDEHGNEVPGTRKGYLEVIL